MSADIQLIEIDPVTRQVSFGIQAVQISGISKLIQIVVLCLLDNPGQDVLNPERGAGFPSMVGQNFDLESPTELFAEVAQRVRTAQTEIISNQVGLQDPPEEMLAELQILSIAQGANIDEVLVTIRIINGAGRAADIVL